MELEQILEVPGRESVHSNFNLPGSFVGEFGQDYELSVSKKLSEKLQLELDDLKQRYSDLEQDGLSNL